MLDVLARRDERRRARSDSAALDVRRNAAGDAVTRRRFGLAGRVLVVTIGFALLAMGLFYVTRLAAFRETWLHNKVSSAQTAFEAFDAGGAEELSPDLARKVLESAGVRAIVVSTPSSRRRLSGAALPATAPVSVDLAGETFLDSVGAAFRTLFARPGAVAEVTDATASNGRIAVTLDQTPLVEALWRVSHTFLNIALLIATVVASVLWAALWIMVLRPMRRLTSNIIAFGERPQDVSRIIAPSSPPDFVHVTRTHSRTAIASHPSVESPATRIGLIAASACIHSSNVGGLDRIGYGQSDDDALGDGVRTVTGKCEGMPLVMLLGSVICALGRSVADAIALAIARLRASSPE